MAQPVDLDKVALYKALLEAIAECEEHNSEYHHRTTPQLIAHWKEITARVRKSEEESSI